MEKILPDRIPLNGEGLNPVELLLARLRGFGRLVRHFYFFSSMIFRGGRVERGGNRL
jgi:hypothetical protein